MNTKYSILICDDDQDILDMTTMILTAYGYRVTSEINSANIYKALEVAKPNLIIIDLWMPIVTGDQVIKGLKKSDQWNKIPIIVFSASNNGEQMALNAGADAYLPKPFNIEQLLSAVKMHIDE